MNVNVSYTVVNGTSGFITLIYQNRAISIQRFRPGELMSSSRSFLRKIRIEGVSKFCLKVTAAERTKVYCQSVNASIDYQSTLVELQTPTLSDLLAKGCHGGSKLLEGLWMR